MVSLCHSIHHPPHYSSLIHYTLISFLHYLMLLYSSVIPLFYIIFHTPLVPLLSISVHSTPFFFPLYSLITPPMLNHPTILHPVLPHSVSLHPGLPFPPILHLAFPSPLYFILPSSMLTHSTYPFPLHLTPTYPSLTLN